MVNDCIGSSVEYSCPSVCVCVENFKDIKVGNVNIQPVNYVNVLGLYLDNKQIIVYAYTVSSKHTWQHPLCLHLGCIFQA